MGKPHKQRPAPKESEPAATKPVEREIAIHRRCPVCWDGHGGYGRCYSTAGMTAYYRCQYGPSPCGHTWSVKVTHHETIISHRTVQIVHR